MNPIFSVGIHSLWDELNHMSAGGVWWINTEREEDAFLLANQTIPAQRSDAQVAVISGALPTHDKMQMHPVSGPDQVRLFTMKNSPDSLAFFTRDLMSAIDPRDYLFIFITINNYWQNISSEKLYAWISKISTWAIYHNCTLLVINPGNNSDKQHSLLINQHRYLDGLASLRWQSNIPVYDVAWWCNEKGVSAQQQLRLSLTASGWQVAREEDRAPQPRNDEKQIYSHVAVLEGAPPLSKHWQLFDDNVQVFEAARTAQAATVIFSLMQNNQIEGLARQIHTLRRQRGTSLKIIVRENQTSLRAIDERLLLSSGANMVIAWNAPLSRCLTLIESVQGQRLSRPVPEDIATLLNTMQPLKLRGFQPWDHFCRAVETLMSNPALPQEGKGVMVALRPVPGIRVEQALTLCRPVRVGDIATLGENRLVLFLSFCRINDLDTALKHIFPLPIGDIFSNRQVWFNDAQITAEINQMQQMQPDKWGKPLPGPGNIEAVTHVQHDGHAWRHIPEPITLLNDAVGDKPS